ncbi:MAG: VWA domain-containing protein [Bacteroidales bacterium]|nr:VWA domain-containing protein [Bacteroidales bacterium]HOY38068.1 VWA domain-containing protein [Bacteroidales bacterium]HQP03606.1 VWA domain-containing protein [Bacteroidales bacterium]
MFNDIRFLHIEYFWLLSAIIPMSIWYVYRIRKSHPSLNISSSVAFSGMASGLKVRMRHIMFVLRMVAFAAAVAVLARPQSENAWQTSTTEGIDIMLAIDISGSMLAEDLKPNRLEAAKDVAIGFINARQNDRIGLVIFGGESFTQCPLTTDKSVLVNLFKEIRNDLLEDGTAIGSGLATSVSRLKESDAKSKVIILLTDGVNNSGAVAPVTAAEIAKTFGVRVYTIGVGRKGTAPYPVQTAFGTQYRNMEVKIDEDVLKEIAKTTGGQYFRAEDNEMLKKIYQDIDQLEKTKLQISDFSKPEEKFFWFAVIALAALLCELILRFTIYKPMP